jgi:PAS domain S-box-containing protein
MVTPEGSFDQRVLVLMPSSQDAERTRELLAEAGMASETCADLEAVCRKLPAGAGAVLLTDEAVSGAGAARLRETLAAQPAWSDVPLVVLTREGTEARHAAFRESANATLVERPVRMRTLLSVVRSALRARRHQYQARDLLAERRRAEESQAYLVKLADTLRPLSDPDAVQAAANRVLGEHLGANRVLYFEISGSDFVVERGYADGVEPLAGRYPIASFGPALLTSFLAGRTVVEADATIEPGREPAERAAFEAIEVQGHVDVPLVKAGGFVAAMTVHSRTPRAWSADEVTLIEQTAERTWAAVERARAERALRASEERFRSLFESMDEGYCVIEPVLDEAGRPVDYRYLLANPALEHHTGLRDVIGKTALEVMPGHESRWIEAYARVAATGEPIRMTDHVADLGRWYEVSAFPVGGQVGVLFANVTARHMAEQELRAGEARLAEIFRLAPSFMCVLSGPDHVFERVNDRYLELIGGRTVVGLPVRQALPEIEGQGYFEMLRQVYRTGEPYTGIDQKVILNRDQGLEERVLDFVYQPIRDPGGIVTGVLVQGIDTTERKRAEAALRERDERLQLAVATARLGTFEIDLATDAVTVNEPGRDIYGWDDTRTTFSRVQTYFHPDDKDNVMRQVDAAFDPAGPGVFEVEQRIIRTDGAVRWLRVRGRALFEGADESQRAALCIGAYLDVTEQKEAEHQLRDADRKKDDFIALLAHELRNPLAPIRNGLQVLRLAGADEEAVEETREIMERQITHMVRLIDDLLDISRINRNKMELRLGRVTLAEAVNSALETARPTIEAGGHTLVVEIPDLPIHLEADLTRLAQVFGNLLTNSAKYTRHGGRIRLSAESRDGEIVVSVSDNGIGIPAAALTNIFDMFSQVDRSVERSTGGLGIGLALVKGLVEMHGGTVSAASDGEGQGSTFTVTLPVVTILATPALSPKVNGKSEVKRRILVVDDSRDGASTLARMLCLMGNDVQTANDGLEGVEAAREFRPEVVLMDIGMPVLNGLDATRRIREQEWGRAMRIIALTGWGQEGDKERSREAGCDGHLVKPVDLDDLMKLLGTAPT